MAKGQKRSNRETKKPKAARAPMETMQDARPTSRATLERIQPGRKKH
jgi:hypothetical protein